MERSSSYQEKWKTLKNVYSSMRVELENTQYKEHDTHYDYIRMSETKTRIHLIL